MCGFFRFTQPNLEFAKLKGELSQVPEYEKVIEHGHKIQKTVDIVNLSSNLLKSVAFEISTPLSLTNF